MADGDHDRDHAARLPHLQVRRVDPQVWPVALDRAPQERLNRDVDVLTQPTDLAFRDAGYSRTLTRPPTDQVEIPWMYGSCTTADSAFAQSRRGSWKAGKLWPVLSLGMLNCTVSARVSQLRSRWPFPVSEAVTALLPIERGQIVDQPRSGKDNHFAQKNCNRALSHGRLQVHRIIGHRRPPLSFATPTQRSRAVTLSYMTSRRDRYRVKEARFEAEVR
jgi:hypothetical protein